MIRFIKQWSEAESFTIFENHVYTRKNLTFAINLVNFLASKLIQHVIAIGSIKYRVVFCQKFGKFSSIKVDSYLM